MHIRKKCAHQYFHLVGRHTVLVATIAIGTVAIARGHCTVTSTGSVHVKCIGELSTLPLNGSPLADESPLLYAHSPRLFSPHLGVWVRGFERTKSCIS